MTATSFVERVHTRSRELSPLVLGVDPDLSRAASWMDDGTHDPGRTELELFVFAVAAIEATSDLVAAVKFQSAFFEQHGTAGVCALARSLAFARQAGVPTILDAKRGDIGSTATAYARAYLAPGGSDLEADALTVNPFLGPDAIEPFFATARAAGKGLFVLVKTSNAGSGWTMDLPAPEGTLADRIAEQCEEWSYETVGASGYGLVGAVVGATYPEEAARLRDRLPHALILAPGLGAQGGSLDAIRTSRGADGFGVLVPVSRGLVPERDEVAQHGFRAAMRARALGFVAELSGL